MKTFNIDEERHQRIGFPEIVYGRSKPLDYVRNILEYYTDKGENTLITKLQSQKADILSEEYQHSFYDPVSEVFILRKTENDDTNAKVAILSGGTSDAFIVNEVYYTLSFLGVPSERIMDIGVSGIHRLLTRVEKIRQYDVLIVVAGFEGALPTVVGGLLPQPVIAVPTSVGYGVSKNGQAALSTMLSSCANGITVVNIDNGYGAAIAAIRILNMIGR